MGWNPNVKVGDWVKLNEGFDSTGNCNFVAGAEYKVEELEEYDYDGDWVVLISSGSSIRWIKAGDYTRVQRTYEKAPPVQAAPEQSPPIGLTPRNVVTKQRTTDILEAMQRYVSADKEVPVEWLNELVDILPTKEG